MKYMIAFFAILGLASAVPTLYDAIACDPQTRPRVMNASNPVAFSSPGFNFSDPDGSNYDEAGGLNLLCEWRVDQDPGQSLELSFFNFSVEGCSECACDNVTVYDGPDDSAPEVRSLCGSLGDIVPNPFLATGDSLFIKFQTNNYPTDDRGFLARAGYQYDNNACTADRPAVITDERPGFFLTENYPVNYQNDEICEWSFEAPAGQRIEISFSEFEVEDCCNCDYLEVFDGDSVSSSLAGRWYANQIPARMTSSSNRLYLRFQTDFSVTYPGFLGSYRFIDA